MQEPVSDRDPTTATGLCVRSGHLWWDSRVISCPSLTGIEGLPGTEVFFANPRTAPRRVSHHNKAQCKLSVRYH